MFIAVRNMKLLFIFFAILVLLVGSGAGLSLSSGRNPAIASASWTEYGSNPRFSDGAWTYGFYDGSTYHFMYDYVVSAKYVIGHATASSPTGAWTKDTANNPVLSCGGGGTWDAANIYVSDFWLEGGTWYMIYLGYDAAYNGKLGLATASSASGPWTKSGSNPVLTGSYSWEMCSSLSSLDIGMILKAGSTYYIYYSTGLNDDGDRCIGVATSTNLISWTKQYTTTSLFKAGRYAPGCLKYGDFYYMTVSCYGSGVDYSYIELWRSLSPLFTNPELIRICHPAKTAAWQAQDQEEMTPITSAITRDAFPGNVLYTVFAGCSATGVWTTGVTQDNDIAAAVAMV